MIYIKTDNNRASFTSLPELISWLEQHQFVDANETFVLWTENGNPATARMNSLFLRISKPTIVSVASPDKALCRGFLDIIADALQSLGIHRTFHL